MPENIHDRITYDLVDGVARVELAHSHAPNSLDQQMGRALRAAADRAAVDAGSGDARSSS